MDVQEWEEKFKPVLNHLDSNASWQDGEGNGIMFETYGKELEHILFQMLSGGADTVWTYVDGDSGTYVVKGMQFVNRIGYFITRLPANHETDYEILVSKDLE